MSDTIFSTKLVNCNLKWPRYYIFDNFSLKKMQFSGSDANDQHDSQRPELAKHVRRWSRALFTGLLHLAGPGSRSVQRHSLPPHLHQALHQKESSSHPLQSLPTVFFDWLYNFCQTKSTLFFLDFKSGKISSESQYY